MRAEREEDWTGSTDPPEWEPCPEGEALIDDLVERFLRACPAAARLAADMGERTGTRFFDWVDHVVIPPSVAPPAALAADLAAAGFVREDGAGEAGSGGGGGSRGAVFAHPGAIFPRVVVGAEGGPFALAIEVESVEAFASVHGRDTASALATGGRFRRMVVASGAGAEFSVVERYGWTGLEAPVDDKTALAAAAGHAAAFRGRRRAFPRSDDPFSVDDDAAYAHLGALADAAAADIGPDWAADLFFAAERDFWMGRNRAALAQKARQDALGLGWANHDHHTYRSRRETFHRAIAFFERLGCRPRERFYAGAAAGWGAQILEHPGAGVVVFADVDLSPEEVAVDFAHAGLPPRQELGTVGLWCELHGDSLLRAGMHHLECQFDFDRLAEQLPAETGVGMMAPFSDLPHLRQQFTEAERWPVAEERVVQLRDAGRISREQAWQFITEGAPGSHLENLQRRGGFKGFNQAGISDIIARTDPRGG